MLISEIFYSLQGEGELTGTPSVFVRTSGCNLRCTWCDTPYASWYPKGDDMSLPQILDAVTAYRQARHVVLTGGEPMVARGIHELAAALKALDYHITIETAGTVPPRGIACDLASVSPKFENSTPSAEAAGAVWVERHERTRWQPAVLREWFAYPNVQCKVVVSSERDAVCALSALKEEFPSLPTHRIFLMPEGTHSADLRASAGWLADFCLREGCRFCDRLHIHLFGNTKGT